ncbi:multiheme c-type cytochrome [Halalkalibaculum sp. DA3122]|uniref:multiheme c-type cytochrome n=1 Tax=Halalkalibaculum sp. DA3122 TaxID=3373607 RepID=UPI0037553BF7
MSTGDTSANDQKWTRPLLITVAGFLLFEMITGLIIYFLPFGIPAQVSIIIHTAIGIAFSVPYLVYQVQHWRAYRHRPMNEIKLTGYISMASALAAIISGLVITWQALFSTAVSTAWDKIHILATFMLLASVLPHVGLILIRDYRARKNPQMKSRIRSEKAFGINSLLAVTAQFGLVFLFIYAFEPVKLNNELPEDYHHLNESKNRPFAPSLATTTGEGIDDRLLGGSESCTTSGCHSEIGKEWEASAHRYAAEDPIFRAIQKTMGEQKGPISTRYCGGCHDPISLFSGTKNLFSDSLTNNVGLQEGISCVSCHAVKEVDVSGNADYTIAPPERYMFELNDGKAAKAISDFLIRAYPKKHVESYQRPLLKTPEFCGSCHKQYIDEEINNVGWVQLQNQYDNWRKSRWNHPKQPMKTVECRECHMPLVASSDPASGDPLDYNRSEDDGTHRSHRFLGANQMVPGMLDLPGAKEHQELTEQWLRGEFEIPEIADKWVSGPSVPIEVMAPSRIAPDADLEFNVTITNNKAGHNFPTGPLDMIQAWLQVVVTDEERNPVYTSGMLDENHFIEPGAFIFKAEPVDQYGNVIDQHNLWEMVGVRYSRAIYPGHSDNAQYTISLPDSAGARRSVALKVNSDRVAGVTSLHITARLQYRKINQYLMNLIFEDHEEQPTAPITTLSADSTTVHVTAPLSTR